MAQWVRLMLGGGVFEGKRLVSEAGFAELVKPQMKVAGPVDYGLGWFLREWKGKKVVEHGGNIDGFNAQVALLPEERLGFVLLTNVTASPIGQFAMQTIWSTFVEGPEAAGATVAAAGATVDPQVEAGTYAFPQAGFDVEVAFQAGKLSLTVPGQPTYPLEHVGGRRYRLGAPAPAGFFVTFRAAKENPASVEAYLQQPQGNFVLPKKVPAAAAAVAGGPVANADLIGSYADAEGKASVEVANLAGKVSLVVPGQPPYAFVDSVRSLAQDTGNPANLYTVTNTGLFFRSQDSGVSWSQINNGLTGNVLLAVEVTANAVFLGGNNATEAFVTRLNADGSALNYSTFLGASLNESAVGVGVDDSGKIIVAGNTNSPGFPVANAVQPVLGGSNSEIR